MIKAEHNRTAMFLFNMYINRLLRKSFSNFFLTNEPPEIGCDIPLIVTPNHISWWDGFFIDFINKKIIRRSIHLMMLEDQLKRYWFFRYVGAYSIKQGSPLSVIETANYSGTVTNNPRNINVIFPQGEIEPYDKRPVSLKSGLQYFIKGVNDSTLVQPVLFKIQFENNMKPAVYTYFAETIPAVKVGKNFDSYKKSFEDGLCQLDKLSLDRKVIIDLFKEK